MKQLYPKVRKPKQESNYRWRIHYDLVYDGGGAKFGYSYKWLTVAKLHAWWLVHISSWGGTAILEDKWEKK